LDAQSFKTIPVDFTTTVEQLARIMSKKLFRVDTSLYCLVEAKNNTGVCARAVIVAYHYEQLIDVYMRSIAEVRVLPPADLVLSLMSQWPEDADYALMFKVRPT
jgi:hypothetical protein